ncbi:putative glycerol defect protein 1 suppressor [Erysiphe necator]|uniref:Putative glycerol defect protein 1 suppressor n=1 Tax=Uncinula necator TaxID=52586 RepID=A0A0B1P0I5_UNCNE|nr:putative glycerol defect protein 1 suppressor [Erysiphe necator]
MKRKIHKPKLPHSILGEIEQQPSDATGSSKFRLHISARKELRKAERNRKATVRHGPPPLKRVKLKNDRREEEFQSLAKLPDITSNIKPSSKSSSNSLKPSKSERNEERKLSCQKSASERQNPKIEKLSVDDREIIELEKKLGIKKSKKMPQSFKDDGLDKLLENLESGDDSESERTSLAKTQGDQWLNRKRQVAQKAQFKCQLEPTEDNYNGNLKSLAGSKDNKKPLLTEQAKLDLERVTNEQTPIKEKSEYSSETEKVEFDTDSFSGFESEDLLNESSSTRIRENPYLPPKNSFSNEIYKPPSLRKPEILFSEDLNRLRRRVQGLINRLTESNLISILGEVENLYRIHPRQDVTSTLLDILLESVCIPTSLPDTLIILPAGLITAIYKVIGTDFGAEAVQRIVLLWDEYYARAIGASSSNFKTELSKETSNLIMLIAMIYIFQVIGSNILFDYIRFILKELSELNTELLLKIIRTCGPQLRQDDPSSLKDIVVMVRTARAKVMEQEISVRTRFMIETINDLKNNRMKTGGANSAITSNHIIRMKKILGSLNNRTIKATEPLRIGLKDIHDSNKKGKWWLVGASWSGHTKEKEPALSSSENNHTTLPIQDTEVTDLVELAMEQRMNTDVRRAIFLAIMSASDYQEACAHLEKLRLKKNQEYEIPKVLIRCIAAENSYNPYYTLIARKLCGNRKFKMSFQYCLWDLFKRMDESQANDSDSNAEEVDEGTKLNSRVLINLAKMYGNLVVQGSLGLDILKNINRDNSNWVNLPSQTKTFLEIFFITIFLASSSNSSFHNLTTPKQSSVTLPERRNERIITSFFTKIVNSPDTASNFPTSFIVGLQYFLKHVSKTDLAGSTKDRELVQWACKVARSFLQSLLS